MPDLRWAARSPCVWRDAEWWPEPDTAHAGSWHLPRGHAAVVPGPSTAPFTHSDWRISADLPGQFYVQMTAHPADADVWNELRRGGRHLDRLEREFGGALVLSGRGHRGMFTIRDQWSVPPFPGCLTFRFRPPTTLRMRLGLAALRAGPPDGAFSNEHGRPHPEAWIQVARWAAPKLYRVAVELDDLLVHAKTRLTIVR